MNNLIFICILALIWLVFFLAHKKDSKVLLILGMSLLSLIAGLRGKEVGLDTPAYYDAFINNFPKSWQFEEIGFRTISMLLMNIFNNPTFVFCVYAFVTNFLIGLRLWDFRKKCNFPVMIFLYLTIFFLDTMNIMRQFIVIAIIFYSTRFLERKKYLTFLIITLLSTFFHKSCLLALLLIVIYFWNNLKRNQKIVLIFPIIICFFIGVKYVIGFESGHIDNYFSSNNSVSNVNITFIYRLFAFLFSFLLIKSNKKITYHRMDFSSLKRGNNSNEIELDLINNEKSINDFKLLSIIYFIGLCFSSMGMFFFVMSRIGYYYLIFEVVYWGYIIKNYKNSLINFSLISVYGIYVLSLELLRNGSGIFPYYFSI